MPRWLYPLLLAVPAALIGRAVGMSSITVFVLSAIGLIPLAGMISMSTEALAEHLGERFGGLLNATFGNAAELIIGITAIAAGLPSVVRASITGSIIGNALLVLGTAMLLGGWRYGVQTFDARTAGQYAALLALAVVGMSLPSLGAASGKLGISTSGVHGLPLHELSLAVAIVLLVAYAGYIAFSVFGVRASRRDPMRRGRPAGISSRPTQARGGMRSARLAAVKGGGGDSPLARLASAWMTTRWLPIAVLGVATAFTALVSESLVSTIEPLAQSIGLSPFFVGLIVLPIVGNAAEHTSALTMALSDRMEASMAITAGSSIQIALLVAPVLVLVSTFMGKTLDLDFNGLELITLGLIAGLYALVSLDGESTWLEGLLLAAFYIIVAAVAFFIPG